VPDAIATLFAPEDFHGQPDDMLLIYPREHLPARRLLLLGLGPRDKLNTEILRRAAARATREALRLRVPEMIVQLPQPAHVSPIRATQAQAEGIELAHYRMPVVRAGSDAPPGHTLKHCTLLVAAEDVAAAAGGVARGQAIAQGIMYARDLTNTPGNLLTPALLAESAQAMASRFGMQTTILDRAALQAQGFGGLLAVGQGSTAEPRFIIIEHGAPAADRPTICLVGKGITFDSGGISIKPGAGMDDMKMDMGGAAAVLGAMQAAGALALPLHIVALIGAAENMPDGTAFKPGDVITTLSGQTIEILNTDAEGRIVLADALFDAQQYQPAAIIDIATLTGAMRVALGPHAIGVMGTSQAVIDRLIRAGITSDEPLWQLPLWEAYRAMVRSSVADLRNTGGGREAGAIVAAALLAAFVGDYPWAHLDIAGTAWKKSDVPQYQTVGATGAGVALLTHLLLDWANKL
jgi:leucyl aminopeptidase